jgi:hypothetical protein
MMKKSKARLYKRGITFRRINTAFLFGCFVSILLFASSCSTGGTQPPAKAHVNTSPKIVSMDASWAQHYSDLPSIKKDAYLAVRGKITSVASTSAPAHAPMSTYFNLTIEEILWNPHHEALQSGSKIVIHQEGGLVNGVLYQTDDDPLLQVGEETILFLHQYAPGQYFVQGGPSGRFKVNNGTVTPISSDGMPLPRTGLNSFRTQITKA